MPPFLILLLTVPFIFATGMINSALIAENRQKIFFASSTIGFVINIALNWLLIPPLGIAGAAIATLMTSGASVTYIWVAARRVSGIGMPEGMGTIYGATAAMAALSLGLMMAGMPVWAVVPIAIAAYAAMLKAADDPALAIFKR